MGCKWRRIAIVCDKSFVSLLDATDLFAACCRLVPVHNLLSVRISISGCCSNGKIISTFMCARANSFGAASMSSHRVWIKSIEWENELGLVACKVKSPVVVVVVVHTYGIKRSTQSLTQTQSSSTRQFQLSLSVSSPMPIMCCRLDRATNPNSKNNVET